jgi:alkylation response protein AidB-like acyl-CoA dehydrogenase
MKLDFDWPDELEQLSLEAREVGQKAVASLESRENSWMNGFSKSFALELGRRGWLGMTLPREDGGHGRSPLERFAVYETLIGLGAPIASAWFGDRQVAPSLVAFGTPEQRERFLPDLIAGNATWCIGMSEPDAGSDLASLRTNARRTDGGYLVNGLKTWTSFGEVADYCYLICRTSVDGPQHTGLSELIVPLDSPGVSVSAIRDMTGNRHFCEVSYEDVAVPAGNLVGREGGSWRQTMRQLDHERGGIDRLLSNRALYLDAVDVADTADPAVRQEIGALAIGYRIGRLMVLREVVGQAPPSFSAVTKVFCTEHEQRVAQFIARSFGLEGLASGRMAQGLCYSPAYTIMGGTSAILRNIIGERVLGLPREPPL